MKKISIPQLATRHFIPASLEAKILEEEKEEELRKKQFRHDWLIAIFSTIGGAIAGFVTSLIFWLLTKQ